MTNTPDHAVDHLRVLAEQRRPHRPAAPNVISAEDFSRTLYELEIHREELEIQNEELRRAQLDLRNSRDRYVDLYDFAPVGYVTLDEHFAISEANLTACRMLGSERSRLIGMRLDLLCDIGSRAELRAHLNDVIATGNQRSAELQFGAAGTFFAHLESCRVGDEADHGYRCRTVITDVTARRQAEQLALEKDQRLRLLADALPVLISYLDSTLRFRFSNRAFIRWFGLTPEELEGRTLQEALGDQFGEEILDYLNDALDAREVTFESRLTHRELGVRHVRFMLVPDTTGGTTVCGVHTLCIDITDQKTIDEQNSRRRAHAVLLERLTADERRVYELLIKGNANKVIALELDIGMRSVERRRQAILQKLEVESLAHLLQQLADIQGVNMPDPASDA